MTALLAPPEPPELLAFEPLPLELPTFRARARASALRLGIHPMDAPHIYRRGGTWMRTRADRDPDGRNAAALAHVRRLNARGV